MWRRDVSHVFGILNAMWQPRRDAWPSLEFCSSFSSSFWRGVSGALATCVEG